MGGGSLWVCVLKNRQKRLSEDKDGEDSNDQPSRWPELPDLVLHSILMRLPISDFVDFSGVWRPWRSFSKSLKREYMSSHPHPPLLMFHLPLHPKPYRICSIKSNKFANIVLPNSFLSCCIGSYHGCLIMRKSYYHRQPQQPVVVSLSTRKTISFPTSILPTSLAVLSSPPTSRRCLLVSAYGSPSENKFNLQCCQRGDTSWRVLLNDRNGRIVHVAAIKNKVYTLFRRREHYWLFIAELALRPTGTRLRKCEWLRLPIQIRRYGLIEMQLVQFGDDDILLICSYYNHGRVGEFQLYKLDLDGRKLDEVDDLGGCALFLSSNGSVVSREPGRWGGMENSIYFIEQPFHTSWGIYSLNNASLVFRSSEPLVPYYKNMGTSPAWIPREPCFWSSVLITGS